MNIPIGRTHHDNPIAEISAGRLINQQVSLTKDDHPHADVSGLSMSGKSTFLLWICMQLIKYRKTFCLIDPHGELYRKLLAYLCLINTSMPVHLFDPSYEEKIVGFNSFLSPYEDEARLMTKARRMCTATLRVFGLGSLDYFGNLERWLTSIYYTMLELKLTVNSLDVFLYWDRKEERDKLISRLRSQTVKNDLREFYSVSRQEFKKDLQSTRNKLQRFTHQQAKRIMGLRENTLDLQRIVDNGEILLCNLQPAEDDLIGATETNLLGTLLINDLWELTRKRKEKVDYYLLIDESSQFVGQDAKSMLAEAAKYGLRIWLVYQESSQVKEIEGALKNARTKIAFTKKKRFNFTRVTGEKFDVDAPDVKSWPVSDEKVQAYIRRLTESFLTAEEVDRRLYSPNNEITPTEEPDPCE